jgi:hydroxymethylglutaryl-CoA reductase (NADPH)
MTRIPRRDGSDDYTAEAAAERRAFLAEQTGARLEAVGRFAQDPADLPGNIEHFLGAAQVPIGVAGPLLVDGEHARGEFYVPLATTEGTLVASYNRGMKLLREVGGVRTTIVQDRMQRAPAFAFDSAREARAFGAWIDEHLEEIAEQAHATTSSGRLESIQHFGVSKLRFCRFNYTTGDAAGQNMTGKATAYACRWIAANAPFQIRHFQLEANVATDKKASYMNMLHTRGKRVVAEATLPSALLERHMNVTGAQLYAARRVSHLGGMLSGTTNNGSHAANAITAIFIACGQDVANVAESSVGYVYAELLDGGDYYFSITLPSLIVATHGGGTGLATQRECLELLDCHGAGKVGRLAEIVAATVLCGEISLGSAIVADEWVTAHDRLGRNR